MRAVLGRPVFFVDDDAGRDARGPARALADRCAGRSASVDVQFQYEPIAAALDPREPRHAANSCVLVADIGGGTSDFLASCASGQRAAAAPERRDDILANHGVHKAGTDFDRHVELASHPAPVWATAPCGPARAGETPREVPERRVLRPRHLAPDQHRLCAGARGRTGVRCVAWYAEPRHHARLMTTVLEERLGHALASAAEQAKIDVATSWPRRHRPCRCVEPGWPPRCDEATPPQCAAGRPGAHRPRGARETLRQAGVAAADLDALYFTGGSTGLQSAGQTHRRVFSPARARCVATASPAWPPGWGCTPARVFSG
jgi:hypothetical chaperone protein